MSKERNKINLWRHFFDKRNDRNQFYIFYILFFSFVPIAWCSWVKFRRYHTWRRFIIAEFCWYGECGYTFLLIYLLTLPQRVIFVCICIQHDISTETHSLHDVFRIFTQSVYFSCFNFSFNMNFINFIAIYKETFSYAEFWYIP